MTRRQKKLQTERRRAASLRRVATGGSGLAVVATLLSGTAAQASTTPATVQVTSDLGTPAASNATTTIDTPETLADAIAYADNNYATGTTKITFASDLSGSTGQTIDLTSSDSTFSIDEPITIDGSGADVTVSGGYGGASPLDNELFDVSQSGPTSWLSGASAQFDDLTLTGGGYFNSSGASTAGAIFADQAPVTVSGSTIEDSHGTEAGGLYSEGAALTVTDSTVTGNTGEWGGGIYVEDRGSLTVDDSTVSGNTSQEQGGGVSSWDAGSLTISGSTITGNAIVSSGAGGVYARGASASIAASTISGNTASAGAGGVSLYATGGAIVENSTIADNYSGGGGGNYGYGAGGLNVWFAATLVGDTVIGNTTAATSGYAGGITSDRGQTLAIDDSILEGNTVGGTWNSTSGAITPGSTESDVWSLSASGGSPVDGIGSSFSMIGDAGNIDSSGSASLTAGAGDKLTDGTTVLDPGLSPLQTVVSGKPQVMVPSDSSPAVDAGDAGSFAGLVSDGFKSDELGATRPTVLGWTASLPGDGADIGAVELGALEIPAPAVSGVSPNSGNGGTAITINGSDFWGTPTVTVGGVAATSVKLVSETQITAVVPSGLSGTQDVLVKTGSGTSTATSSDHFSYPVAIVSGPPPPPAPPKPRTQTRRLTVGDQRFTLKGPAGTLTAPTKAKLQLSDKRLKHGAKVKFTKATFSIGGKHKVISHRANVTERLATTGLKHGRERIKTVINLTETIRHGKHHHTKKLTRTLSFTINID